MLTLLGVGQGQNGVNQIDKLIETLCARSTYCENKTCTTAILQKLENCKS
jgi:hypothetical protein